MTDTKTTAEIKICTILRPEGMRDSSWIGGTWVQHTPNTSFVVIGERAWLLTSGSRGGWRVMDIASARAEWCRLIELGYVRSESPIVDVVAIATLTDDRTHVIDDAWSHYREGVAHAGPCPVLRPMDRRGNWSICHDVTVTDDASGVFRVGQKIVDSTMVRGYEVAEAIVQDTELWGLTFEGVSESIFVDRRTYDGGVAYLTSEAA